MAGEPPMGLTGALPRPGYEEDQPLFAADLQAEQDYRRQRLRRHLRYLHGWGVVCGLFVVPEGDPDRPWAVRICPGYAVSPHGDELHVPTALRLDFGDWLWTRPSPGGDDAFVGIRAGEEAVRRVATVPPGCRCEQTVYRNSRRCEVVQAGVLWTAAQVVAPSFDLCRELPPVPPCPDSPYLLLARVRLPADADEPVTATSIDHAIRHAG